MSGTISFQAGSARVEGRQHDGFMNTDVDRSASACLKRIGKIAGAIACAVRSQDRPCATNPFSLIARRDNLESSNGVELPKGEVGIVPSRRGLSWVNMIVEEIKLSCFLSKPMIVQRGYRFYPQYRF